jgi:predicted methyltransferase
MSKLRSLLITLPLLAASAACATPAGPALDAALAGAHRAEQNRARDAHRHPKQTLEFFGLKADMTVVELSAGGGWYTEVLAPVLRERGKLIVTHFDPAAAGYRGRSRQAFDAKLAKEPALYDKVEVVTFAPPERASLGAPGSADMVLTFRNVHNWMLDGSLDATFAAANAVLRQGGTFGVVEHRAAAGTDAAAIARTGYVPEAYVIDAAARHGFELVAKSELNANPKDTKDHPEGVWTLPPNFRLGDKDRAKYAAIGESDRMTLKFRKK